MNDDPSPLYELPPPAELRFPDPFGDRYRVGDLVSDEGSFSRVHEATDVSHGGRLALKLPRSPSPQDLHRLRRTAKSHEILTDPRIARTRAAGQDQATGFIFAVEDFSPWISAHEWSLNGSGPDPRSVAFLIREVADAMERVSDSISRPGQKVYAVHRDIKPANIKVDCVIQDRRASPIRAILIIDWLQSYFPDFPGTTEISANKVRFGTPGFWAPEVSLDLQPPDHQSDICSLAHTAFYLLRGHAPADGQDVPLLPKHYGPRSLRALLVDMGRAKRDRRIQSWAQVRDRADRIVRALDAPRSRAKILAAWAATAVLVATAGALWLRTLLPRDGTAPSPTFTNAPFPTDPAPARTAADRAAPALLLPDSPQWSEIEAIHDALVAPGIHEDLAALHFERVLPELDRLATPTALAWRGSLARARDHVLNWFAALHAERRLHQIPLADGTTLSLWIRSAVPDAIEGNVEPGLAARTIGSSQLGAAIFDGLPLEDRFRAVLVSRGPQAALALAARSQIPPTDVIYALVYARILARGDEHAPGPLAEIERTVEAILARGLPERFAADPRPPGLRPSQPPPDTRFAFPSDSLRELLSQTRQGLGDARDAPWWPMIASAAPGEAAEAERILGQARSWALFLDEDYSALARDLADSPAFDAAARRLAAERRSRSREILWLESFDVAADPPSGPDAPSFTHTSASRDVTRRLELHAPRGQILFRPTPHDAPSPPTYLSIRGTFQRAGVQAAIVILLTESTGRKLSLELTNQRLRVTGLEPRIEVGLPHDLAGDAPHLVELAAVGTRLAVLEDGRVIGSVPALPAEWPPIGVRQMHALLSEVRECPPAP